MPLWPGHVRLAETYFVVVDIFVLSYVNYMTGGGKCLKLVLYARQRLTKSLVRFEPWSNQIVNKSSTTCASNTILLLMIQLRRYGNDDVVILGNILKPPIEPNKIVNRLNPAVVVVVAVVADGLLELVEN